MVKISAKTALVPLAMTQLIASFAGSNMNVAISSIAEGLGTSVKGVQIAITLFLLTMAALMITGSKLTDIWGRKRCLMLGLIIYGLGTLISAFAPNLGFLIIGYSFFQGVGSALMIPPVYIITTTLFQDMQSRAKAFGVISGMGGAGAAAGPLLGGLITTAIGWRASFIFQTLVILIIIYLTYRIPAVNNPTVKPRFDLVGAVISSLGMFFAVFGILQAGENNSLMVLFLLIGAFFIVWFFRHIRRLETEKQEPLIHTAMFANRSANINMLAQNIQWLILMGISFVVSVYFQIVRGYSAIQTGLIFTAATVGLLISSLTAGRWAKKYSQRLLVQIGFVTTVGGIALLLLLANLSSSPVSALPGLFFAGLGIGLMLTPSVNMVQSSFSEKDQGEISGLSRSISNLGSSLGTALAGTILVAGLAAGRSAYALALLVLGIIGLIGFLVTFFLPPKSPAPGSESKNQVQE